MASKAAAYLVCPACGSRNKPKWEFCVACGESLQGVGPGVVAKPRGVPADQIVDWKPGLPWLTIAGVIVLVGAGYAAYQAWRSDAQPAAAGRNILVLPTQPPATTAAAVTARGAGLDDFEAARKKLAAGDKTEALALLAKAVAAEPGNARYGAAHAQLLWDTGNRDGALTAWAQVAANDPQQRGSYARALASAGRDEDALREYEQLLSGPSATDPFVTQEAGRIYARKGDHGKALPLLQAAAKSHPTDAVLGQELGWSLQQTGDMAGAESAYRKVLAQKPAANMARTLLADVLAEQGKGPEAVALLNDGLARTPEAPSLHQGLGRALEKTGDTAGAIKAYREYARLAPNAKDTAVIVERIAFLEKRAKSETTP